MRTVQASLVAATVATVVSSCAPGSREVADLYVSGARPHSSPGFLLSCYLGEAKGTIASPRSSSRQRVRAERRLAILSTREVRDKLLSVWRDKAAKDKDRVAALGLLIKMEDPQGSKELEAALESSKSEERMRGLKALWSAASMASNYGFPISVPMDHLRRLLADSSPEIRLEVLRIYWRRVHVSWSDRKRRPYLKVDRRLPVKILDAIADPDPRIGDMALRVLCYGLVPGSVARLGEMDLSTDPGPRVRLTAIEALGASGDPEAEPPLLQLMQSESERVRSAAVTALGRLWAGSPNTETKPMTGDRTKAVAALIAALDDDSLFASAVYALTQMKAEGAEPRITELISEMPGDRPGGFKRLLLVKFLAAVEDPRASDLFAEMLADGRETLSRRARAGEALSALGQPAPGLGGIKRAIKMQSGPPAGIHSVCIDASQSYFAERSDLGTDLQSSGTAITYTYTSEFDVCTPPGLHQLVVRGGYTPLELASTSEEAAAYFADLGLGGAARFGKSRLFARWALGLSLGALAFDTSQPTTVGVGYWGRAGIGVHVSPSAAIELFGDVHGWLGFDSDGFRTAGLSSAGLTIAFLF